MLRTDRDPEPVTARELEDVAVFPLPRLVFFPGTELPLHFFEPRYLSMVEDITASGPGALAVTMLEAGHDAEVGAQPPMKATACVGRIVAHERLADGRHNIVLRGMLRVRLEELPMARRLYRRARATRLEDCGRAPEGQIGALLSCAQRVIQTIRREHPDYTLSLEPTQSPSALVDVIADGLLADHGLRQRVLETLELETRLQLVMGAVAELMATLSHGVSKRDLH